MVWTQGHGTRKSHPDYRLPDNIDFNGLVQDCSIFMAWHTQGDSISRCHLTSIGNHIAQIRRSKEHLISTMGFSILIRWYLNTEWDQEICTCRTLKSLHFSNWTLYSKYNKTLSKSACPNGSFTCPTLLGRGIHQAVIFSVLAMHLHSWCTGDTTVLHWTIDLGIMVWTPARLLVSRNHT